MIKNKHVKHLSFDLHSIYTPKYQFPFFISFTYGKKNTNKKHVEKILDNM